MGPAGAARGATGLGKPDAPRRHRRGEGVEPRHLVPDVDRQSQARGEQVVVAEARRTLTSLALYGYRVDALVANRVFPPSVEPFLAGWVAAL